MLAASCLPAGCHDPAASVEGLSHRVVADGRDVQRDYFVQDPGDHDPAKPLAVTFVFHGANGTASDARAFGIQNGTGAATASVFVFPQGDPFGTDGVGWDDSCTGYDMTFFDRMLADVEAHDGVDGSRVFVAGFSWGCDFVTALACCRGDRIRAVAAAACSDEFRDPADERTYANLSCPVTNRAAIRFTHQAGGDGAYPAPLFATTSRLFRSFNACPGTASAPEPGACTTYPGCAHPTLECTKRGIGHAPGPTWGADSWAFFSTLP